MNEPELPGIPSAMQVIDAAEGPPMTLDEHIAACLAFREQNPGSGSWRVQKYLAGARMNAGQLALAFTKLKVIKDAGRAVAIPQFWQAGYDDEASKGPPVVRLK